MTGACKLIVAAAAVLALTVAGPVEAGHDPGRRRARGWRAARRRRVGRRRLAWGWRVARWGRLGRRRSARWWRLARSRRLARRGLARQWSASRLVQAGIRWPGVAWNLCFCAIRA